MEHRLKFRHSDKHLRGLEQAFTDMMVAIADRTEGAS